MFDFNLFLENEIRILQEKGLFREMKYVSASSGPVVSIDGEEIILFSSNNYLGLAEHPEIIDAQIKAIREFGSGFPASRLISGNNILYQKLEKKIARFKDAESAVVFPTGYMANLGVISAVVGKGDLVICDKLNHASIIDGVKLSGADLRVYPHKNLEKLKDILKKSSKYEKKLIISDGVFSMDGDIVDLPKIIEIKKKYNAILMIDDAHAGGVLGKNGKGTKEYFNTKESIDIEMGTLSKALANLGGFIAGSNNLIEYIRNKARSLIYTTALPPSVLAGSLKALDIVEKNSGLRENLWSNVKRFRHGLLNLGYDIMDQDTQIIPIMTEDIDSTLKLSQFLFKNGIFAPGIRPPTVAKNKCRIRISIMATHTEEQIDKAIKAFGEYKMRDTRC